MKHLRKNCGLVSAVVVFALLALPACTPYRIDIQQGNVITSDQFALIRLGMTRDQVKFVLGTPLLTDVFHDRRWDYVYHFEKGSSREVDQRKLTIWFGQDQKVERIDADSAKLPADASGGTRVYELSGTPVSQEGKTKPATVIVEPEKAPVEVEKAK